METNCKNCGAVIELDKDKCPYCHTPYGTSTKPINYRATLLFDGETVNGYVADVKTQYIYDNARDINGRVIGQEIKRIRTIKFVEC